MHNTIQKNDLKKYMIDIADLPEAAHQEFISFYNCLILKYKYQKKDHSIQAHLEKNCILSKIFKEAKGVLPVDYTFNRDELHER